MLTQDAWVDDEIGGADALEAYRRLIAQNDALIRGPELDNGRRIVSARAAVIAGLVRRWAQEQQRAAGYTKPFAVVALGGTGRAEITPCSDLDFAFLFDDALEGNAFLLELQRQTLHSDEFERRHGFACRALPFNLEDVPGLQGKQLNAFLDMRPVFDPQELAVLFRERIRRTYDSFEHFLHVYGFWKREWDQASGASERLDRFDIKHEGLRLFLAGIWSLAGKRFVASHEIYRTLEDPRDLEAYDFLLRIRAFVHLRRAGRPQCPTGPSHAEDVLGFDDFTAFGEMLGLEADEQTRFEFANTVRARLLSARRRVALFARGIIERELKTGRVVSQGSPIVLGGGGLCHTSSAQCQTPRDKSRAALSLVLAAQRYEVPIDPTELQATFRDAGDWLTRVPELSALFYEPRGSLADSLAFLARLDGVTERLFPGYARFEASLDDRVMTERKSLRGALARQKIRALELQVREGRVRLGSASPAAPLADLAPTVGLALEAALLDTDHLAAVKLALATKRLPLTDDDQAARLDRTRSLVSRFSSGFSEIPLADYYAPYAQQCDFTAETVRLAEFLVANRRAFKVLSEGGLNDARQVEEFARLCRNPARLRALFVFTCADRAEWESEVDDPARWFTTRELFSKTLRWYQPRSNPADALQTAGYAPEELNILRDFGEDFFGGSYRQYANRFGGHLVRLAGESGAVDPRVSLLREGKATIVGVAARDYRGLAASITGALWRSGTGLRMAHLFSARHYGLALDFFHLPPRERPLPSDLARVIEEAIRRRLHIGDADAESLPRVRGTASLREWRPGQYCLRFETSEEVDGLIYSLAYQVFRRLRGNIFGLTAHAARGKVYVSVYHSLPADLSVEQAQAMLAQA